MRGVEGGCRRALSLMMGLSPSPSTAQPLLPTSSSTIDPLNPKQLFLLLHRPPRRSRPTSLSRRRIWGAWIGDGGRLDRFGFSLFLPFLASASLLFSIELPSYSIYSFSRTLLHSLLAYLLSLIKHAPLVVVARSFSLAL
ncbi:hypothetical protein BDY24DRAFT_401011 [Mrakia frigida]|uniref:uncharacterized protein n=1 Tax=Mrakia frigida TaxID=29902 RepID=UPI003FCBF30C